MRVFVAGAGGFIGSELVRTLGSRGHEAIALLRTAANAPGLDASVRTVAGDVTRRETFESAAKDADAIVNLALPDLRTRYRRAHEVWMQGTRSLTGVGVERGMRAYIHASGALGVYRHPAGAWIDETAPEEPFVRYTRGRRGSERLALTASRDHGLPVAILRPPNVYGRGGPFAKYFLDYTRRGIYRVPGDGSNYTAFVHVADCALAYALAVERAPKGETFLVADDTPLTLREASDAIADALHAKRPGRVPPFLARLVIGADGLGIAMESVRLRNEKAKTALGWSPRFASLRDGLPSVVS